MVQAVPFIVALVRVAPVLAALRLVIECPLAIEIALTALDAAQLAVLRAFDRVRMPCRELQNPPAVFIHAPECGEDRRVVVDLLKLRENTCLKKRLAARAHRTMVHIAAVVTGPVTGVPRGWRPSATGIGRPSPTPKYTTELRSYRVRCTPRRLGPSMH